MLDRLVNAKVRALRGAMFGGGGRCSRAEVDARSESYLGSDSNLRHFAILSLTLISGPRSGSRCDRCCGRLISKRSANSHANHGMCSVVRKLGSDSKLHETANLNLTLNCCAFDLRSRRRDLQRVRKIFSAWWLTAAPDFEPSSLSTPSCAPQSSWQPLSLPPPSSPRLSSAPVS
jgi:hypothetical protein